MPRQLPAPWLLQHPPWLAIEKHNLTPWRRCQHVPHSSVREYPFKNISGVHVQERGSSSSLSIHSHCSSLSTKFPVFFPASICFIYFARYSPLDHIRIIQSLFFSSLDVAASFLCSSWHIVHLAFRRWFLSHHPNKVAFEALVPTFCYFVFAPTMHLYCFRWRLECLLGRVWHGAISVSGLSLEGIPVPKHLSIQNVLLTVWKSAFANVFVLCWFGSMPLSSPCPRCPWKDAITQLLATVSWAPLLGFVQAKKWWLTEKSSEVSLLVSD